MKFKLDGFDKLEKQLNRIQKNADRISGDNEIPFKDLFNQTFMTANTGFNSIDTFFKESPFLLESEKDFEAIPINELDKYVSMNTSFDSWEKMLNKASQSWVAKQLDFK